MILKDKMDNAYKCRDINLKYNIDGDVLKLNLNIDLIKNINKIPDNFHVQPTSVKIETTNDEYFSDFQMAKNSEASVPVGTMFVKTEKVDTTESTDYQPLIETATMIYNSFLKALHGEPLSTIKVSQTMPSVGVFAENHGPDSLYPARSNVLPELTTTIPEQLVDISPRCTDCDRFISSSSLVTPDSEWITVRQQQIAPGKRLRINQPGIKAKKQKSNEKVDPDLLYDIAKRLPKYRILKESEISSVPTKWIQVCSLIVPYEPYPFEPILQLCHLNDKNFAYRFYTREDPNTNTRFDDQTGSENPQVPKFACLQCGISFTRAWVARRHSLNIHNVKIPVYKRVCITIVPQ